MSSNISQSSNISHSYNSSNISRMGGRGCRDAVAVALVVMMAAEIAVAVGPTYKTWRIDSCLLNSREANSVKLCLSKSILTFVTLDILIKPDVNSNIQYLKIGTTFARFG